MPAANPMRDLEVTTLDLLKVAAVALMIVDHVGLYLYASDWLRVLGRPAAVTFGFLIGFSRSRTVPGSWVALGLALTLLNRWLNPDSDDHTLDILISLALTRISVPLFERLHDIHPMMLLPLALAMALVAEPLNDYLEYGTEVAIVALLGVAVRLDTGRRSERACRDALALVALVAITLVALRHFQFSGWLAVGCAAAIGATTLILSNFKRATLEAPGWLAPLLRFTGRNTLMIYAIHLALFQIAGSFLDLTAEDAAETAAEKDDDEPAK